MCRDTFAGVSQKNSRRTGTEHTVVVELQYIKPFKPITKATISRWVKTVLKQAGFDVGKYTAHSSRAACTSHTKQQGLNLQEIIKSAGWTCTSTFEGFYHKPMEQAKTFGEVLLDNTKEYSHCFAEL